MGSIFFLLRVAPTEHILSFKSSPLLQEKEITLKGIKMRNRQI